MPGRSIGSAYTGVPFEYTSPTKFPQRTFWFSFVILCAFVAFQTHFPVYVIGLSAAVWAFGLAVTAINVKRYPVFAETMNVVGFALAISIGHFVAFNFESTLGRHRSVAMLTMATKHVPSWFRFRRVPCLVFLLFSLVLDWASGYLMVLYYGDEYTISMALNACLWTCVYAIVALAQMTSITAMYKAELDLVDEKAAMEQLLSLLCDTQFLIHGNGDTLLRSSPIFDSLMGRAMETTKLSNGTWFSAEDAERLRSAFDRARNEPVILPISIASESSNPHNVDFLIVSRGMGQTMARPNYKTNPFCGASRTNDKRVSSFLVGVRITNVLVDNCQTLECRSSEGAASAIMTVEENALDSEIDLEDVDIPGNFDFCDIRSIGNSTTVTGQAFKRLDVALKTGDEDSVKRMLRRITAIGRSEKWLVPSTNIILLPQCILGRGGFGIVIRGKTFGTDVAVKFVKTNDLDLQKRLSSLLNELRVLRGIHHPCVVQFFGACLDIENVDIALIFEKVSGVCLHRFACGSPQTPKDMDTRCSVICDIAGALRFLHAQEPSIVHSDLKPANVMVESSGWGSGMRPKAKILDFGLARFSTRSAKVAGGTLRWMAPEILKDSKIVLKPNADVYSFGHLLFFLNTGREPLEHVSREEIFHRARLGVQEAPDWPDGVEPFARDTKDVVARCVNVDASLRPPMDRVHIDTLRWKTHQDDALFQEETTWAEGLKIVRSEANLPHITRIHL